MKEKSKLKRSTQHQTNSTDLQNSNSLKIKDLREQLNEDVTTCTLCSRLVKYRETVAREKKKSHLKETYWGRPVPDFGDPKARLLIVGLAPAAHGANRTGRMFTGDRSGQWLYRALHRAGFSNQNSFENASDGLILRDCLITAVIHCAPPENKPSFSELRNCEAYLSRTFALTQPKVILALGSIAWNAIFSQLAKSGDWSQSRPAFKHGAEIHLSDGRFVIASYHPSQQNTFTKRLTEEMFDSIFSRAKQLSSE